MGFDSALSSGYMEKSIRLNSLHRLLNLSEAILSMRSPQETEELMCRIILPHLCRVAIHPELPVALYGCDVLKQIAMAVLDGHKNLDQSLFLSGFPVRKKDCLRLFISSSFRLRLNARESSWFEFVIILSKLEEVFYPQAGVRF